MSSPGDAIPSHPDRSAALLGVQLAFVIMAGTFVLARLYVKTVIVKHATLDDYLIYAGMAIYIAYSAIVIDGCANGATGKHYSLKYTPRQALLSLRGWYLCMVLYAPMTLLIRAALVVLLMRLTDRISRFCRMILWLNLVVLALVSVAFTFVMIFQCNPPSFFWEQILGAPGFCHDKRLVTISVTVHSCLSAASDWCLGLLPVALLWRVQLNWRTKISVAGLLSLGIVAGIVLIIRIKYTTKLQPGYAFLYESTDVAIWSVLEPGLGLIAACLATLRPLFKGLHIGWGSTPAGGKSSSRSRPHINQTWEQSVQNATKSRRSTFIQLQDTEAVGLRSKGGPEPVTTPRSVDSVSSWDTHHGGKERKASP